MTNFPAMDPVLRALCAQTSFAPCRDFMRPTADEIHWGWPMGGWPLSAATGFVAEFPPDEPLVAVEGCASLVPPAVLTGLRLHFGPPARRRTLTLGPARGRWRETTFAEPGIRMTGLALRFGWYIDGLRILSEAGETSAWFGGVGGDSAARLELTTEGGTLRGIWGMADTAIACLGLIFAPRLEAEEAPSAAATVTLGKR